MGYRIGSFNLKNIGKKALGKNDPRDLQKIAEIIKEKFDVVALQEILSEGEAFRPRQESVQGRTSLAKPHILMELGPDWDFYWADVSKNGLTADQRKEGYAFLWNKKKFTLSSFDAKTYEPYIYDRKEAKETMARLPYCIRLTAKDSYFEIRLICIHTYYGNDTKEDRERRRKEINTLLTQVYPRVATKQYGNAFTPRFQTSPGKAVWKRDMPPKPSYTILLGDYNMELWSPWKGSFDLNRRKPAYMEKVCMAPLLGGKPVITVQDELTTLKTKEEYDDKPEEQLRGYAHDYDHFSYAEHLFSGITVTVRRIDAVQDYFANDFMKYRNSVSDHIPIMMEIDLK